MTSSSKKLRFCSFLLVSVITLGLLLGSSVVAYADDFIVINGVTCAPVEITNDQIKAMFDNGDFHPFLQLKSSTTTAISLFDMVNQSSSVVNINSSGTIYQLDNCSVLTAGNSTYINFYAPYSYNMRVNESSTLETYFQINLPFSFYLNDYSLFCRFNYSGISNDQLSRIKLHVLGSDNLTAYTSTTSVYRTVGYWSSASTIRDWYQNYNWVPNGYSLNSVSNEGIRTVFSEATISGISTNVLTNSLTIECSANYAHASGTGWNYFFCAPMLVSCNFNGTVYVPVSYEDQVLEYLDLITGDPTAANQQRIDELTNEFQQKQQDLSDLTEDLTVDVPDITGTIGSIPEDAQSGANDFGTYIFTPIYNIPLVQILVACAFGFAIIKLVLYGSGAS